ncbi:MAG: response regulator [Chitinophagales bacterium]|nr:response regulator [Chitinophagales bacterium]
MKGIPRLSRSNITLITVCLLVIVAILFSNIVTVRNLSTLGDNVDLLAQESVSLTLLRDANDELSLADNKYMIYQASNERGFLEQYDGHMMKMSQYLDELQVGEDSALVTNIRAQLNKKLALGRRVDVLNRISNNTSAASQESILGELSFEDLQQIRKDLLLADTTNAFSDTATVRQMQSDVLGFAAKRPQVLQTFLQEQQRLFADGSLTLLYALNDARKTIREREAQTRQEENQRGIVSIIQAKKNIELLSYGSLGVILIIIIVLGYNIFKMVYYEKDILEAREEAERLARTRTRFLSNMSHEIRSPLTSIVGFAELIEKQEADPEKKKFAQAITASSDHLLSIVNDILDFSKLDAGKMQLTREAFSLKKIIGEVVFAFSMSATNKGIQLISRLEIDEELMVIGDAYRLKQILFNLVSNAVKFTEKGTVELVASLPIRNAKDLELQISVRDTGIGIPADQIGMVFEEFAQASNSGKEGRRAVQGTGLGLPICKMLVELQGGEMKVESTVGKGSLFSFIIPYQIAFAPSLERQSQEVQQVFLGRKAMIVEDNEMNVMLLTMLLRKAAMIFDVAKDGEEALRLFESNHYDIVLADINVPKLTGDQLAMRIRQYGNKAKSNVPVIAMTASIFKDDVEAYKAAGINDILVKPFKQEELNSMLAKYLNQSFMV